MNARHFLIAAAIISSTAAAHAAPIYADNFDANPLGLNTTPAGWTVTDGTVDVIGESFSQASFDFLPGNGAYIDLDGSTGQAGKLSSPALSLQAGVQYTATFDLAGSQRGSTETGVISLGGSSLSYNIPSSAGFSSYTLSFTPTATATYLLSFKNDGGDNVGALLDNVSVAAAVPESGTLALMAVGLLAVGFTARRKRGS